LIFVFFGIGFGTVRTRAVRMSAALVGLIVVLIYWGLQGAMIGLGYSGALHPAAAMMIPNLVILALAVPAFRSAMW
jgi:lipopolysaccharide export LptBFGC system permease protein LptF